MPFLNAHLSKQIIARGIACSSRRNNNANKVDSFCMNMFLGQANLSQVIPFPLQLSGDQRETLQMIVSPTVKFLEEVNDPVKNDENAAIPMEVLKQFAELGAFGAVVPEKYEGAGLNNTQLAKLAELVGEHDLGLGVVMGAHQSIGYKGILLVGTDEQKEKYLPSVATGRSFAAFCLTEPSSGSDANSIRSRAVKSSCGKYYVLNGSKIWISNGGFADVFTVFAQTPIKQADGSVKEKVSAFIVERSFGGVTNGPPEKKMGIKGSNTAEVHFSDVKIPVGNLLGAEGEGFKVAMHILNNGRFSIPAACTGSMRFCIRKTIEHINSRVQFGHKLREFGNVKEKVASMIARHYVTESIVYMLSANMDKGIQDFQLEAAIGKVLASENAWHVCDEAIQLHGGMGFMRETELERVLRDLRIFRIFEGANDVMRLFIGLTGLQFAGKQLTKLASDIKSFNVSVISNELQRRLFKPDTISPSVNGELRAEAKLLNDAIVKFGAVAENLLKRYRNGIIDRQYEVVRLANAAINCYAIAVALSRCNFSIEQKGLESAKHEIQIVKFFTKQAYEKALLELNSASNVKSAEEEIDLINGIATAVCDNQTIAHQHPIAQLEN